MTYIVAWKLLGAACVIADSAVTREQDPASTEDSSREPLRPQSPSSSFGERHFQSDDRVTEEGAIKLLRLGNAILAFSGDVADGRQFAARFNHHYVQTADQIRAFRETGQELAADTPRIRVVLIGPSGAEPLMLSFNVASRSEIVEHSEGDILLFGSAPTDHRYLTRDLISEMAVEWRKRLGTPNLASVMLVQILALLQSHSVTSYSIPEGFGGAYVGAFATSSELHWQPDILFVVHHGVTFRTLIASFVRSNALVLISSEFSGEGGRSMRAFIDTLTVLGSNFEADIIDAADARVVNPEYDFVVFLSSKHSLITGFDMRSLPPNRFLRLRVSRDQRSFTVEIRLTPGVAARLEEVPTTELDLRWFP